MTTSIIRKRTKPEKTFNYDDIEYVHKNYSRKTAKTIANERGLAKFQVDQIIHGLRVAGVSLPNKTRKNLINQYAETVLKDKKMKS